MKIKRNIKQTIRLTTDSEDRLLAYATAASVGAFFAGQSVEGQVTESQALAPYPHTLVPGAGTGYYHTYFYLDIDGDTTNDFNLDVNTWRVDISGTPLTNLILNPSSNAYVIPWTNGMTLNATTGSSPTYKRFLANSSFQYSYYLFNNFTANNGALGPFEMGFSFTGGDGQTHFGYMDIQVNGTKGAFGDFTATVNGIYYNKTPNADITIGAVPVVVTITRINVGQGNAVTINFTSTDNAATSAFTLETSPVLGASANWTADAGAVISSSSPGVYQAVTTGSGGPAQFFRISH
jgi:hypothetical protein